MVNSIKRWKEISYCKYSKWLGSYKGRCSHCYRIARKVLTFDGVRSHLAGDFVDNNREEELVRKLYAGRPILRRLLTRRRLVFA